MSPAKDEASNSQPTTRSWPLTIGGLIFKVVLTLMALAIPLLGFWFASSLAVYHDGPLWLAIVAGVLLFPVLPLLWDLWSESRRRKKKKQGERWLTFFDRIIVRTIVLNLVFLVVLFFAAPRQGFAAINARGDWMLGGSQSSFAETCRSGLFSAAGGLEWLYNASVDNPYAAYADEDAAEGPDPSASGLVGSEAGVAAIGDSGKTWPYPAEVHASVTDMPSSARVSLEAAGAYFKAEVSDPYERIKALHDFTATSLAYDADNLADGTIPSQKAADVYAAKRAVCAGYARVMVELGKHTGDTIVYIVGHSRASGAELDGVGHAWNGVEIDGKWYLMDVTWDAGTVAGRTFKPGYGTNYFLTPPDIFGIDHLPDDPKWQLRDDPLDRGAFLRQAAMSPRFHARGLTLASPTRSQTDVEGEAIITLNNPRGTWLSAIARPKGGGDATKCGHTNDTDVTFRCALPSDGIYSVTIFAGDKQYGKLKSVGSLEFINDG